MIYVKCAAFCDLRIRLATYASSGFAILHVRLNITQGNWALVGVRSIYMFYEFTNHLRDARNFFCIFRFPQHTSIDVPKRIPSRWPDFVENQRRKNRGVCMFWSFHAEVSSWTTIFFWFRSLTIRMPILTGKDIYSDLQWSPSWDIPKGRFDVQ